MNLACGTIFPNRNLFVVMTKSICSNKFILLLKVIRKRIIDSLMLIRISNRENLKNTIFAIMRYKDKIIPENI